MSNAQGFETAAATLVQTVVEHNLELQEQLNSSDSEKSAQVLKPWYKAMVVMTGQALDAKHH